jgi:hypothetical protein
MFFASLHLTHEEGNVEVFAFRFPLEEDASPQRFVTAIAEMLLKAMR